MTDTVYHEIAHHFGISDARLHELRSGVARGLRQAWAAAPEQPSDDRREALHPERVLGAARVQAVAGDERPIVGGASERSKMST